MTSERNIQELPKMGTFLTVKACLLSRMEENSLVIGLMECLIAVRKKSAKRKKNGKLSQNLKKKGSMHVNRRRNSCRSKI